MTGQKRVLDHLLHPVVSSRLVDTELYGNEYPIGEMMSDLTTAIFAADLKDEINTFRRNLQVEYVVRLSAIMKAPDEAWYGSSAQALALYELMGLKKALKKRRSGSATTTAHTQYLLMKIARAHYQAAV